MAANIVVPQIGEAVAEVHLLEWLKQPGDPVKKGEVLFRVDTDKAVVEVEAFADGVLAEIITPAGSSVQPQQVVGRLSDGVEQAAANQPAASGAPAPAMSAGRAGEAAEARPAQRIPITPRARERAKALGIDLARIVGTGENGLITTRDVEQAAGQAAGPHVVPYSRRRQAIARKVQASKQTVPHFYLLVDVNMTQAQKLRTCCVDELGWDGPPTYTELLVRACALALASMPAVNAAYSAEGAVPRGSVDIGVAVGLDDGLVVPVLANADQLALKDVSIRLRQIVERARQGALTQAELGAKSMVVSNLGMFGVDAFMAIIDVPDPMILAAGRIADRVVPTEGGGLAVAPYCTLTLSADHRALDGVTAAKFLSSVAGRLENPDGLLG